MNTPPNTPNWPARLERALAHLERLKAGGDEAEAGGVGDVRLFGRGGCVKPRGARGMKERPILFSGPMVRAILEGRKTQTRRVIPIQPTQEGNVYVVDYKTNSGPQRYETREALEAEYIPAMINYGIRKTERPGDRLWVRETWARHFGKLLYRADFDVKSYEYGAKGWKPSVHMPRVLSRLTLEITDVRVERLHQISGYDALKEGVTLPDMKNRFHVADPTVEFMDLWDGVNAKRGYPWSRNPWVWVVSFGVAQGA